MAITSRQGVAVGNSAPAILFDADKMDTGLLLQVKNTGANAMFLGGSGVTAASGYPLGSNETLQLRLEPGDDLYAICAATLASTAATLATGLGTNV